MQVLEIIQPNEDKQLDEFIITGSMAIGALGFLAYNYLGGLAVDQVAQGIRAWQDNADLNKFKPTGKHIPDQTRIQQGKDRLVYNAKEEKWGVQKKNGGKWRYKLIGDPLKPQIATVTPNMLKAAIKNKTLSFGNKLSVLKTMQAQFIETSPGKQAMMSKSGNMLEDLIDKESGAIEKTGKTRLARRTFSGKFGAMGGIAKGVFSRKGFQLFAFIMPAILIINAMKLKAWYVYKLNYKDDAGNGWPLDDGSGVYDEGNYAEDIKQLRSMTIAAGIPYMMSLGIQTVVKGALWIIYKFKKEKLLKRVPDKGTISTIIGKFGGAAGKIWKMVQLTLAGGLVYGTFDRNMAETIVGKAFDLMMLLPGSSNPIEAMGKGLADSMDSNWGKWMTLIGADTPAEAGAENFKNKQVGGKDYDPFATPEVSKNPDGTTFKVPTVTVDDDPTSILSGFK